MLTPTHLVPAAGLALGLAVALAPRGGHTSGATSATRQGSLYRVTLETPRIEFAREPLRGGRTREQEFHEEARVRFDSLLDKGVPHFDRSAARLQRDQEAGGPPILPFSPALPLVPEYDLDRKAPPGPCRVSLELQFPDLGHLELSLGRRPTREEYAALQARVRARFARNQLCPALDGAWFRLTAPFTAASTPDAQGAPRVAAFEAQRVRVEAAVETLRRELGAGLSWRPYDEAIGLFNPFMLSWDAPKGACRVAVDLGDSREGSQLEVSLDRPPSAAQVQALDRRARELIGPLALPGP